MNVRELIAEILVEIGLATDAGSISDQAFELCRSLINRAMLDYNMQDYLHFTKDALYFPGGTDTIVIPSAPVKVATLSFVKGRTAYRLRRVPMDTFPAYLATTFDHPRVFVYDRVFNEEGQLVGRIRMDRVCNYPLTAVVNNNLKAYNEATDVVCIPPEYLNLIRADVQYRLLANRDASDSLKNDKIFELNKVMQMIKDLNEPAIDTNARFVEELDVIHTGYGRL